MTVLSLSVAYM